MEYLAFMYLVGQYVQYSTLYNQTGCGLRHHIVCVVEGKDD